MVVYDTFTAEVPRDIEEHNEFQEWLEDIDGSEFIKVGAVIEKIINEGLITSAKNLNDGLYEKKWNSGLRLYFTIIIDSNENKTLLLLGSLKGLEQTKAIKKARTLLFDYKIFNGNITKK